jgi:hypothetical protein
MQKKNSWFSPALVSNCAASLVITIIIKSYMISYDLPVLWPLSEQNPFTNNSRPGHIFPKCIKYAIVSCFCLVDVHGYRPSLAALVWFNGSVCTWDDVMSNILTKNLSHYYRIAFASSSSWTSLNINCS